MPLTRALSARLQVGSRRQSAPSAKKGAASDDIVALKLQAKASSSPSVQAGGATRALVAGTFAQLNVQQSSCKGSSSSSTTSAPAASTSSRSRYVRRGSSHFSSRSSTSSRRSILGSSDFRESSDDENDDQRRSGRLGGCSAFPLTADRPDDSNKENVAPFRCASQDVLETEARDAQHEDAIRRTSSATRTNSLMERHTFSSPRRLSRSSTTSDLSTTSPGAKSTMPMPKDKRGGRSSISSSVIFYDRSGAAVGVQLHSPQSRFFRRCGCSSAVLLPRFFGLQSVTLAKCRIQVLRISVSQPAQLDSVALPAAAHDAPIYALEAMHDCCASTARISHTCI
ncbi:hypothetical protein PHSY_001372 [Pseudozyma hubeiensis SY62]|uniref:Uncharacterized protein n=1 Tax=Pseudozyma hubeiensis (strain SY62) TaxID=1305764 RepID=R9NYS0_PSEHS|nr:hypothetical protein PHSY_001372 [Pseudozyma hubeiensis SY62]GAC93807.1 hypothetical protein PHSY_001372 [Pseudozyma hubeiensis SY62]